MGSDFKILTRSERCLLVRENTLMHNFMDQNIGHQCQRFLTAPQKRHLLPRKCNGDEALMGRESARQSGKRIRILRNVREFHFLTFQQIGHNFWDIQIRLTVRVQVSASLGYTSNFYGGRFSFRLKLQMDHQQRKKGRHWQSFAD